RKAESAAQAAEGAARQAAAALRSLRIPHNLAEDCDVVEIIRVSAARRALESGLAEAHTDLIGQGDGQDETSLRQEASGVEFDVAAAEVPRLENEISGLQQDLQQAAQEVILAETALRALRGREGIGEAAQAANDAAAEMVQHVQHWLRLKAAAIILNKAVERYRAANQHPVVQRASEIFAAMVAMDDNPICRLSEDYTDEERPVLVGFRRDGSLCPVSGMSDGTSDQLYLALRIAVIERTMEGAEPMPFVADDLFITSDDQRTRRGVKVLAELGKRTQVLLFTHHGYVVEAAQAVVAPECLRVHRLREAPGAALG
ncbi:MAG: hypothetical protein K2Q10_12280, partial [Rhodospirillales bacterium]|nr:hypothetical protein [Rhodospirillales bacterium]